MEQDGAGHLEHAGFTESKNKPGQWEKTLLHILKKQSAVYVLPSLSPRTASHILPGGNRSPKTCLSGRTPLSQERPGNGQTLQFHQCLTKTKHRLSLHHLAAPALEHATTNKTNQCGSVAVGSSAADQTHWTRERQYFLGSSCGN